MTSRSPRRAAAALLATTLCTGVPAAAQTLKTLPLPGLWEHSHKATVNGVDLMAQMREAQAAMMKGLSAAERAQLEQMMKAQGGGADLFGGGPQQECVTPQQVARYADPKAWLRELQAEQPNCSYEPVSVSGDTVSFKGRCKDADGYTGDMLGSMTQHDPKRYTGRMSGNGVMAGASAAGLKAAGGKVDYRMEFGGRWLAAACGAVKPR